MISSVSSCAERSAASVFCTSKLPESCASPPSAVIVKLGSTSVRWPDVRVRVRVRVRVTVTVRVRIRVRVRVRGTGRVS